MSKHQAISVSEKMYQQWVRGKITTPDLLAVEVDLVVLSKELSRLVAMLQRTTNSLRESRLSEQEQELVYLERTGGI